MRPRLILLPLALSCGCSSPPEAKPPAVPAAQPVAPETNASAQAPAAPSVSASASAAAPKVPVPRYPTDAEVTAFLALPTRVVTTTVAKITSTVTVTIPERYVYSPLAGHRGTPAPAPAESCSNDSLLCSFNYTDPASPWLPMLNVHVETRSVSSFADDRLPWQCTKLECWRVDTRNERLDVDRAIVVNPHTMLMTSISMMSIATRHRESFEAFMKATLKSISVTPAR